MIKIWLKQQITARSPSWLALENTKRYINTLTETLGVDIT